MAVPRCFPALVAALAALASVPGSGATLFTASNGDWFDGASWDGGFAPTAADDAVIDNGGTATASSSSPGAAIPIAVNSLAVGSRNDAAPALDVSGTLELSNLDLAVAGDLSIGDAIDGDEDEPSHVSGGVSLSAGDQTAGNLSVGGVTRIGRGDIDGSTATGRLAVDGNLDATDRLFVGAGWGASGEAVVGGNLLLSGVPQGTSTVGGGSIYVASSGAFGFGDSPDAATTGSLDVAGDLRFFYDGISESSLFVGTTTGAGRAEASATVGGDVLGFGSIDVGVATHGFPEDGEAVAIGELHVAGLLDMPPLLPRQSPHVLSVGVARGFLFSGSAASARGYATIGQISSPRILEIGVGHAGTAIGEVHIGSGDVFIAEVGTSGLGDGIGTLVTGGGVTSAQVGTSLFGGGHRGVGSVIAGGSIQLATVGWADAGGTAAGYLEVESVVGGDSSSLRVGMNFRESGIADGHVVVRSGGIDTRTIAVGMIQGSLHPAQPGANGSVTGLLESTGDVTSSSVNPGQPGNPGDLVGYANAKASGTADGTWIMHDGTYTGRKLIVGLNEGASTVTGRIHLDQMLIDVDDITLGDGATVELEIQGLLRGSEYSAIDATVAKLDGALAVQFVTPAQLGSYDLLVSGGLDGITGAFDAVSVTGLASGQSAYWGIETTGGASPVEVFRLRVVPEPQTGALLAMGIVAIAVRARACRRVDPRAV